MYYLDPSDPISAAVILGNCAATDIAERFRVDVDCTCIDYVDITADGFEVMGRVRVAPGWVEMVRLSYSKFTEEAA